MGEKIHIAGRELTTLSVKEIRDKVKNGDLNFSSCYFKGIDFGSMFKDFPEVDQDPWFVLSRFENCKFSGNLERADFTRAVLSDCSFNQAKLSEGHFLYTEFIGTKFHLCDLSDTYFSCAQMRHCNITGCDLSNANFKNVTAVCVYTKNPEQNIIRQPIKNLDTVHVWLDGATQEENKNHERLFLEGLSRPEKEIIQEKLADIRDYENSIELPPEDQSTYFVVPGILGIADESKHTSDFLEYAEKCKEYLRFGREVDRVFNNEFNRYNGLKICDTPQILLDAGFEQRPMLYTQKHLREAMLPKDSYYPHRHDFSLSQIKQFPEWMQKPVIIADNPSRPDAVLMVLPAVDHDRLPVVASIKPNGSGFYELAEIETNMILTVFGKDRFEKYFENVLTPDKIIYFDKEKGQELERLAGRQLPGNYSKLIPNHIIRKPECFVKLPESEKKLEKQETMKKSPIEMCMKKAAAKTPGLPDPNHIQERDL